LAARPFLHKYQPPLHFSQIQNRYHHPSPLTQSVVPSHLLLPVDRELHHPSASNAAPRPSCPSAGGRGDESAARRVEVVGQASIRAVGSSCRKSCVHRHPQVSLCPGIPLLSHGHLDLLEGVFGRRWLIAAMVAARAAPPSPILAHRLEDEAV
jgi:hypothetical protein